MNGRGKSHSPDVPAKPPNKDGREGSGSDGEPQTGTKGETLDTAKGEPKATREGRAPTAEEVEGRGLAEGNLFQQNMLRTQDRAGMCGGVTARHWTSTTPSRWTSWKVEASVGVPATVPRRTSNPISSPIESVTASPSIASGEAPAVSPSMAWNWQWSGQPEYTLMRSRNCWVSGLDAAHVSVAWLLRTCPVAPSTTNSTVEP